MRAQKEAFALLMRTISEMEGIAAIGKSGGAQLPENNESDIDIFVFCTRIPAVSIRKAAVEFLGQMIKKSDFGHKTEHWGLCDFIYLDGAEICLMYFTVEAMNRELDAILGGERLEKENNYFYPTGRAASFHSMHALYDPNGYIASAKERIAHYPDQLSKRLAEHLLGALMDMEDMERAVSRKDVLFYHFALDLALDHLLQWLFALNKCFFPSRKRSLQIIHGFVHKPIHCEERLLRVVALGGEAESLGQSHRMLMELIQDILRIRKC